MFNLFQLNIYKNYGYSGVDLVDPFGNEHKVYPRLYSYVVDHPEGCKVI